MAKINEKTSGLITYLDYKKPGIRSLYWVCFLGLSVLALLCILPPVWVILSSLKDINEFYQVPPTIIPHSFHPEKLIESWNALQFGKIYLNTIELVFGSIVFSIILNGMAGYVISRLKPKGSKIIFSLMLWTLMLPSSVSMIPVFRNIIKFPIIHVNLTNSFLPIFLLAGANAFFVLVFKGFFDVIPVSLIEAARIDGCNDFSIFFRIIVPISKPVIMTIMILQLNATWGDFFWPFLILTKPEMFTVMVKIYTLVGVAGFSQDIQVASLVFAIVPPAILFMFFQKYIMQGVTMSGIKG